MPNQPRIVDQESFRRILKRNVGLPLGVGVVSAGLFIGLLLYLLNVLGWVEHTDRVIGRAYAIARTSTDLETGMRGFLISGNEQFLDPYEVGQPRIRADIATLKELVSDNPPQVQRLERIAALQTRWNEFASEVIAVRRLDGDYRSIISGGRGRRMSDEMRTEFDAFIATEQALRAQRNQTANTATFAVIVGYLLFSLTVGILLAYFGRRDLLRLSTDYGRALREHAEHAEHLQRQDWLRQGQTQLADEVIGQLALPVLGRNVLAFLARHIGVVVGAFYVREDQGSLRRVASYGFSREQENAEQVLGGTETLVGQAVQERRAIRLDEVPADYLQVSTGMGQGAPRHVLVAPVDNDGRINGVLELGFMRAPAPRDVDFLTLIGSNVGSSVEAARYRQRLQDVLAETQQLNEELQVQQEELRTANEELEEQSRALKESQTNLEGQQAELEQTNEQLAEQANALADQRDAMDRKNHELNEAQRELQERAEELQRASRYKSEFLANMSHELRTPLNSSLILARLLADNPKENLSAEQVKFAESIYGAGNDLLNLINDILDISKVEAGKLEVRPEPTAVAKLVAGIRMVFEPLAMQKKLQFEVELEPGLPQSLFTDRQRVEQILKNLLSNAIKFTEKGMVRLTVAPAADGGVSFAVEDSGIGIRSDQQDIIFEAFRQADGTTSRRYGGTGLGLSISRDLARLLGGSIGVQSTPGEGSTFTLVLPARYEEPLLDGKPAGAPGAPALPAPAASAPPVASKPRRGIAPAAVPAAAPKPALAPIQAPAVQDDRDKAPFDSRCVLVVEDEPKFAQILYDLAHELGYQCLVAHHAEEGFELAQRLVPDAVLLDMRLPDGSGLTVLERLKENSRTRHIPVHVISVEDRQEAAMHMGAIGYAVKPTTREQLKEVFGKLEAKLSQKVKRILLVEDDALQRDSIALLIGDDDIEITAVEFGEKALELLRTTVFDCMIIDLKLPDMQGNELLRRMSTEDICSFPPVIVYTGRNLTRAEESELLRYSRSIIIKGARSPERLLDEVTLFLHKVESQLSSERQKMLRTARSRDKVFEGRKILLVDDDVRNIFALTSALEQKGAVIEIGRNGREALDRLAEVSDIDLVLMDVMMPEMDGFEATREIRKNPRWQKLPIIAVTAKAMKDDQDRCLQAGANDYLAKPVDLDRLFSLIRVWMPKMERL